MCRFLVHVVDKKEEKKKKKSIFTLRCSRSCMGVVSVNDVWLLL